MFGNQFGSTSPASRPAASAAGSGGRTSFTGFDYGAAYGSNPFSGLAQRVRNQMGSLSTGASPYGSYATSAGSGRSGSESVKPRPVDPEVKDYMANVLGGQRNGLDDYVRRAAGAGIRRGGMNVAGGPALDSALHHEAMRNLASGHADRFRDAMAHGQSVRSAEYAQQADSAKTLLSLLDLEQRALASEADWKTRIGDRQREDWRSDQEMKRSFEQERNRSDPARDLALESARRQMEQQTLRDQWERNDRQRAMDDMVAREGEWRSLLGRSDRSSLGTSWRPSDSTLTDRLGVELGYLKPWQRSVSFRFGD